MTFDPEVLSHLEDGVLTLTFNRPHAMNAMTWAMWDGLRAGVDETAEDPEIQVLVLRGAGGSAFVAGTDITQFESFTTGAAGVEYESKLEEIIGALEGVPKPTIAAIDGVCVGGGLVIAAVCDIRLATPASRFGVPVARTVGNCLSMNAYSLLVHHLGPARTLSMLLEARLLDAQAAQDAGFVRVVESDALDGSIDQLVTRLRGHAPLSMWAAKEAVRRLRVRALPDGDDLVERVFGSDDFRTGVRAFTTKERPRWTGR